MNHEAKVFRGIHESNFLYKLWKSTIEEPGCHEVMHAFQPLFPLSVLIASRSLVVSSFPMISSLLLPYPVSPPNPLLYYTHWADADRLRVPRMSL